MALRPIVLYPARSLRRPSIPPVSVSPEVLALVMDLEDTMRAHGGIGIAAPQIGVNVRVLVLSARAAGGDDVRHAPIALINPIIEAIGPGIDTEAEGCLSFPGVRVEVTRPTTCTVRFSVIDGSGKRMHCEGLLARAVLHEIDHLDGVLLVDHAKPLKRSLIHAKSKKWAKQSPMWPLGGAA